MMVPINYDLRLMLE